MYEPELSYILAKLFNMWLKESFFPVVSKVLYIINKLVNNRIVDHLEKCGLF